MSAFDEMLEQFVDTKIPVTGASIGTPAILFAANAISGVMISQISRVTKLPPSITGVGLWAVTPMLGKWISPTLANAISAMSAIQGIEQQYQASDKIARLVSKVLPGTLIAGAGDEAEQYYIDEQGNTRDPKGNIISYAEQVSGQEVSGINSDLEKLRQLQANIEEQIPSIEKRMGLE